ncbi:MAG: DUF4363 family protein [Clostridiales bacterium]|nr:DUF4363 family protein [Clostridiales bacterium]
MRATAIALVVVLALSLALCALSLVTVRKAVREMDDLRVEAEEFARAGDGELAMERLVRIANRMEDARPFLEMLTSHEDLHDAVKQVVDAQVYLEFGALTETCRALSQLGEILNHIRETEEITLANLW